jgi:hypothetical protein
MLAVVGQADGKPQELAVALVLVMEILETLNLQLQP